jgi:branched-chain amino acid transport system ATP-binding protein
MMLELAVLDAFYGRAQVLFGLSLGVAAGEVAVLIGRNGAGKSTTLRSIIGLTRSRGSIRFEGRDIGGWPPDRIARAGIGYVPEERRLFAGLSVAENLAAGRRPPRPGVAAWTTERLLALFPNLAPALSRPAGRLSGGEQQMLAIARTLAGNPKLILLDEPSEGLAPRIVEALTDAIRQIKADGVAVLLAEQNVRFAHAVSDRAFVLEQGRLRFAGSLEALLADEALANATLAV